ncbi:MAG TPA: LysR family transcriptional regulator [Gemmatimonadales bacterium]|nr:LysR family transcriptional regulator [Gemmatimonadales bacterium]
MAKPGLTLHRLELFLAVLDQGGVGRAAKACNISQPAVSEHLRGLGAHFGVQLLERRGRSVRPTPAARLLEPYARQAVGLLRGAERAAADLQGLRSGSLTVGASTTPGTYLLPAALGRFHAAYPGLALSLQINDTREVERWVTVGQLELGVIGEAPLVPGLVAEPWVQDELVLIVPRGHPFARQRAVRASAIAGEAYIAREEGSSTRGVAEGYLARLGVTLTPAMELGSTEAIREAVAARLGVALVSRHAVLARDRRIVAARLAGPRWTRDLLIVRRLGTPLGPAAAAFRGLLLEQRPRGT